MVGAGLICFLIWLNWKGAEGERTPPPNPTSLEGETTSLPTGDSDVPFHFEQRMGEQSQTFVLDAKKSRSGPSGLELDEVRGGPVDGWVVEAPKGSWRPGKGGRLWEGVKATLSQGDALKTKALKFDIAGNWHTQGEAEIEASWGLGKLKTLSGQEGEVTGDQCRFVLSGSRQIHLEVQKIVGTPLKGKLTGPIVAHGKGVDLVASRGSWVQVQNKYWLTLTGGVKGRLDGRTFTAPTLRARFFDGQMERLALKEGVLISDAQGVLHTDRLNIQFSSTGAAPLITVPGPFILKGQENRVLHAAKARGPWGDMKIFGPVTMKSPTGSASAREGYWKNTAVELRGQVKGKDIRGAFEGDDLNIQKDRWVLKGNARAQGVRNKEPWSVKAKVLEWEPTSQEIWAKDQVTLRTGSGPEEQVLNSKEAHVQLKEGKAQAKGDVHVAQGIHEAWGDKGEASWDKTSRIVVLAGSVRVVSGERRAKGERLKWTSPAGEIILTGNPAEGVEENGRVLKAKEIHFRGKAGFGQEGVLRGTF